MLISMGSMNTIKQESTEQVVAEGRNIKLTCEYDGSIYNIQWYRQFQRSRPEFLLSITEGGSIHPTLSDFSAHIDKTQKHVDLEIISAAVTDSAVYYCAVRPTVTGNNKTLETHSVKALISALKTQSLLNKMKSVEQKENLSHSHVTIRQTVVILNFTGTNIILTFRLLSLYSGKEQRGEQLNIFLIIDMDPKQQLHQLH
uniref:Ig-like domain-containing protein n=1 Tax=Amphiprion ocellaris TaxID=80972 RepID=A0A3Q1AHE2_AMPOC